MEFSDRELATEIRNGSSVAFERLMRRYERLVYRVAYGLIGEVEAARDVAQETFLRVHERLGSWRGERDMKNWIARIAANQAISRKRSRERRPTCELDENAFLQPHPPQEERLRALEAHEALHRSLSGLSPRHRLAIVLRYFQGMSTREISGVLECTEGTARNILFRGLRKLRSIAASSEEVLS